MKFTLPLMLISLCSAYCFAQQTKEVPGRQIPSIGNGSINHETVKIETDKIYDKLVRIRRDFHENPELAGNEQYTKKIVARYLLNLGLTVDTSIYANSVIGILKGTQPGKKIAWRTEMDALPNSFPDPVDFKSKVQGVQHGCGHDVHLAIALGIAEVLALHRASLKGTVYFIFQPEEETFAGAKNMIANGLFRKIKPDEIYGLHATALPVGQIMVRPNEMFAYQKRVRICLKKQFSKTEAQALAVGLQKIFFRGKADSRPWEIQYLGEPEKGLGSPNTIFADYAFMDPHFNIYQRDDEQILETDLYETERANLGKIIPEIKQQLNTLGVDEKLISVSFIQQNPTVVNDSLLTERSVKLLARIYGDKSIVYDYGQVPFFNDDFAYFQQHVKGVYFFLGGSNYKNGIVAMNHAPNFSVDEESIRVGVRSFSSVILQSMLQDK